jgi:SpoVK/Ycf46/Vps4 family AAA+-type ATPase
VTLLVDNVGPVTWNKDAYERLVLPKKTKDLVKALVMVRTSEIGEEQGMSLTGKKRRDDIIAGKGNGLIMLLHGGPGTGKTLTAESVAEIAEMPLYNVTCGDIGTSAEAVEKYLQTVLVLGKTWNCVLLLDEADVFLEERTLSDLERNSLVSVFLRTLEYYDGILILTSNRVGTFDEAFKSRIQVALHYPNLDGIARKKIWKNFFDMMEADEEDVNLEELNKHIKELADQDMNGREIRNSLTTARQLALFQKETLAWEHVEQAIKTARDFNRYLGGLHGHTDDQYARDRELR